jgi:RHS repeat-associated protein
VLGEFDPNGTVTATRKYDVYGAVRSSTGTSTSKHKFVGCLGHMSEDETGLIYMRARYMDPVTGRFVSEDPEKTGANWFAYCADNPVNLIDSNGKSFEQVCKVLAAVYTFLAMFNTVDTRAVFEFIKTWLRAAKASFDDANAILSSEEQMGSRVGSADPALLALQLDMMEAMGDIACGISLAATAVAVFAAFDLAFMGALLVIDDEGNKLSGGA